MIIVYNASNAIDAHLIKDLLDHSGIQSRIDGEFLQGGIGGIQANGLIKVVIDKNDYEKAREIIEKWESGKTINKDVDFDKSENFAHESNTFNDEPKTQITKKYILLFLFFLLIGVLIGAGYVAYYYNTQDTFLGTDYNGDGNLVKIQKFQS
jgi:hypothetical protein